MKMLKSKIKVKNRFGVEMKQEMRFVKKKKGFDSYRISVLSRHPSHNPLRKQLPLLPFRSIVRLGSTTTNEELNSKRVKKGLKRANFVECNSVQGVKNSASKLLMKQCFETAGVKTAPWIRGSETNQQILNWADQVKYPIISKSHHGSRGEGNLKHDNRASLERFLTSNNKNNYIFEKFVKMSREYRLHISKDGCFYTCRKLLRNDAPEGTWQRHDDVVTWALETNESFKKPSNWNAIVTDCIKAQKALGLDVCAFDVMVQGSKDGQERTNPEWIIVESASAPSFGDITLERYLIEIPKILKSKYNANTGRGII